MNRIKILGLAAFAVLALSAVVATAAQAAEGPFFKIGGTRLAEKASQEITAKAKSAFVLKASGTTITCTSLSLEKGAALKGTKVGNSETSEETIVFSGCTVSGTGFEKCEVEGKKITTMPVNDTLDYSSKAKTGKLLTLFTPVKGSVFVTVHFKPETGGKCKVTETAVEGSVAAEDFSEGKVVEAGKGREAVVGEVVFPTKAIKVDFIEKEKAVEEKKVSLKAFGLASTLEGTSEIELSTKGKWTVATE
jgi:hypothetical protein